MYQITLEILMSKLQRVKIELSKTLLTDFAAKIVYLPKTISVNGAKMLFYGQQY